MRTTTKHLLAAVLAAVAVNCHAVQFEAGRGVEVPQLAGIKTNTGLPALNTGLPQVLPVNTVPTLGIPGAVVPGAELITPQLVAPENAALVPVDPELGRLGAPVDAPVLNQGEQAAASMSDPSLGGPGGWSQGSRAFDGAKEFAPIDGATAYGPSYNESAKIQAARGWASQKSAVFQSLDNEFNRAGGYFLMSTALPGNALASSGYDRANRPVVVLSSDLLNRFNGKWQDEYRGAPWEFIASVIAREQVFSSAWYQSIPASAEKLAVSVMNMAKVFADLTDGTTRSWATDKDFQQTPNDKKSWVAWGWYEQLVYAARAAAAGVGRSGGHLIDSKFLAWARDWVAPKEASNAAFQYTLWEQYDGKYYRPGDAKHGQALPAGAPRIDKATYDRESYKVYGADGKGSDANNRLDAKTIFGWIIDWLRGRSEI